MKAYQRRFVTLSLSLIAVVLVTVMTALAVYNYHDKYRELETTMHQVLMPLDAFAGQPMHQRGDRPPLPPESQEADDADDAAEAAEEAEEAADQAERWQGGRDRTLWELRDYAREITALRYSAADGVTVFTEETELDADTLETAAASAAAAEKEFGRLPALHLIYCRVAGTDGSYRIALTETAYITKPMFSLVLTLALVFAAAMLAFFFISYRLSRIAVRPMEQSVEMEKQFVADVSHDLKTPLTVILANTSILKDNELSTVAEQYQWIESTEESAQNMLKMINEMLTLSSMESPQLQVECGPVPLTEIVSKAALQMESVAFERGVLLDAEIAENVTAVTNADYAARVCASLLENALKYEPDGGRIRLNLAVKKKKAVLEVQNFSKSIAPEDLPHIFERFYRADKSRGETKGHGLGLSIVKRMTELSGAQIDVRSSEETGTVFTVTYDIP